jgi:hypothetical protein
MKIWTSLLVVVMAVFLVSCKAKAVVGPSRHNGEIDPKTREAIHQLNDRIVESARKNDPSVMMGLLAEEVKQQPGYEEKIKSVYGKLNELMRDKAVKAENDYEITAQSAEPTTLVIPSGTTDLFDITIETVSPKTFVSLLVVPDGIQEFQLSLIYIRVNNEWKLLVFYGGIVRIAGKSAVGWYKEANELFEKGELIPASLRLQIIQACLRLAPFMKYEIETDMVRFEKKLQTAILAQHRFPIALDTVADSPSIFSFEPQFSENQVVPIVLYLSKIPIEREQDLQNEADAMAPELEGLFKGLTKGLGKVYFRAFSEFPSDPKKQYRYFGMEVVLKDIQKKGGAAPSK